MRDHVNEKDFHLMVMLVALAMCFKPQEEYLSEDQVITRGFSPVDSYTRSCIAKLIDTGAVEFKMVEPDFQLNGVENILYIKRPVSSDCGIAPNFPTQSHPAYPLHASDLSTSRMVGATINLDSSAN